MKSKGMTLTGIVREYLRLNVGLNRRNSKIAWTCRFISGIVQGLGLLALMQLATVLSGERAALGLGVGGWLAVLVVAAVVGAISIYFRERHGYVMAFEVMRRVHRLVGNRLSRLPLGWFSSTVAGKLSRLGASTVNELGNLWAHMVGSASVSAITLVTLQVGLLAWYPRLGLMLLVFLGVYVLLNWGISRADAAVHSYQEPAAVELADRVVEFAACQPLLRACNRSSYPQLQDAIAENRRRGMRALIVEVTGGLLSGIASQIIAVLMIITAAAQGVRGELAPLEVVAVIGISLQIVQYLTDLYAGRAGIMSLGPTLGTIGEVLDAQPLPEREESAFQVHPGEIELYHVDFEYLPHRPVLQDVSFVVPPHTMTALVGPSGSGKTTIARLICRFWDLADDDEEDEDDVHAVAIGGVDVRDFTTEDLMREISMVFQDVYLFNDTLEANVRLGNPSATDEELREAADLAGVSEIVARLPKGWDTPVGEGGAALSGGERQRVSIARAILKRAPILLFDEATSALDAENEANLTEAFQMLRERSTVLVIAHKLNTIATADQIVVLDDAGRVAQCGTHQELVRTPGIYRTFWENREKASGWSLAQP